MRETGKDYKVLIVEDVAGFLASWSSCHYPRNSTSFTFAKTMAKKPPTCSKSTGPTWLFWIG